MTDKRLIETAFPLAEASAASLHEKNMRHGHISTLHLWPARRPLAASRAAISAALLPDPGGDDARTQLVRRLGGRLKLKKQTKAEAGQKVEDAKVQCDGGILWWGHESSPDVAWIRAQIRAANNGRVPRLLDPFSGGGAIPLEAMRLGCEVVANDLNPVAWFVLKCTLEYPQLLADQTLPLPSHAMCDAIFATAFLKAKGLKGMRLDEDVATMVATGRGESVNPGFLEDQPWERADLSWQIRAWGAWVLAEARRQLAARYPTYAEWQTLIDSPEIEERPLKLLSAELNVQDATDALNTAIAPAALRDPRNPRWVAKPTAAYLWARTVPCKSCRANIPLLKTRWLCRKESKRVLLEMRPNDARSGVVFSVLRGTPMPTGSASVRRAADRALAAGTMSRTGVRCPCCDGLMTMDDLQHEARAGRFGAVMTAVVQNGPLSKEYRDPTDFERSLGVIKPSELDAVFATLPFGIPCEPISPNRPSPNTRGASGLTRYGIDNWGKVFTGRQTLVLGIFANSVRQADKAMAALNYPSNWRKALVSYLALASDRVADYGSVLCSWAPSGEFIRGTFVRFALSIIWDYTEVNPLSDVTGGYFGAVEWVAKAAAHAAMAVTFAPPCTVTLSNAIEQATGRFDAVVTDPPYYDAIPYSDLMDFFHVWLRRALWGLDESFTAAFDPSTGPKWDTVKQEGELVDQPGRFGADREASRAAYEAGMARSFRSFYEALTENGVLVLVFANKKPEAWEALATSLIKAGFVVDASWPIKTERAVRTNAIATASLSSSVWLVCRKRPALARPGFVTPVLAQMREKIRTQMHRFWDAGIRGPDFVWAATGPALEAYSRHPVVFREITTSGQREAMPVAEFLREVRRLVVEFAVGRVLKASESSGEDERFGLDDLTTYYVLHRDSFGLAEAPIGACILYAMSCGLRDDDLADRFEILTRTGGMSDGGDEDESGEDDIEDSDEPESNGTGSKVRLRRWDQRKRKSLGLEGIGGRPVPLIDRTHRLMQLWKAGDVTKVNAFLDQAGLARDGLFAQLIQALIELANRDGKGDEAPILESISNHLRSRAGISEPAQTLLL